MKQLASLFLLLAVGLFSSCSRENTRVSEVPSVVVSIPPYISLVKDVVGDTMTVHSVLGINFDPHTAEATPREMQLVQSADLFIGVGEGYEKKLLAALSDVEKNIHILEMNKKIPLLAYSDDSHLMGPCQGHSHATAHLEDLHFWLGPKGLITQVAVLLQALTELKPENRVLYQENAHTLIQKIQSLDARLEKALHPYQGRSIATSHASLGYFCHDYHLNQIAIECEGKDPRPQSISRVYDYLRHSNVICVFTSPQFNNRGAEMVAKELDLRVESFDPLAEDVLATIEKIANNIAK